LTHLERQHDYVVTMSTFQPAYGTKLSPLAWRFQLMVETFQWLTRWKNAYTDYNIRLEDCIEQVTESDRAPCLVKEFGESVKCWCFPEGSTLEEVIANVEDLSPESIKDAMSNWRSTWFLLQKKEIEPGETLRTLRNDQEELGRSMNTCTEVKKWIGAFHIVFELKEGDMKSMVLEMMLQKYKGMDMSRYSKKIHGCTCGQWHRYFICIHAMAWNIVKEALPFPDEWNPKVYKGTSQTFHVTSLLGGKKVGKSKSRRVPDALKRGDPRLLCLDCCKRRRAKAVSLKRKRQKEPAKKQRNVNRNGAVECDKSRTVDATPKTPNVERVSKRRKIKQSRGDVTDDEREDLDDTDEKEGESEEEEEEEEHNETPDTVACDQGTVGRLLSVDDDESEYNGICRGCKDRVTVRRDVMGQCNGKSHTIPENAYNLGFRRLVKESRVMKMNKKRKTGEEATATPRKKKMKEREEESEDEDDDNDEEEEAEEKIVEGSPGEYEDEDEENNGGPMGKYLDGNTENVSELSWKLRYRQVLSNGTRDKGNMKMNTLENNASCDGTPVQIMKLKTGQRKGNERHEEASVGDVTGPM